jgi:hypothetical protein
MAATRRSQRAPLKAGASTKQPRSRPAKRQAIEKDKVQAHAACSKIAGESMPWGEGEDLDLCAYQVSQRCGPEEWRGGHHPCALGMILS